MEQQPDNDSSHEAYKDNVEVEFVRETLKDAGKAVMQMKHFALDDVAQTFDQWNHIDERPIGDAECRHTLTLSDEWQEPDKEHDDVFSPPEKVDVSLQYTLERRVEQSVLFSELAPLDQRALLRTIETNTGNDMGRNAEDCEDDNRDFILSDAYQAMVDTEAGKLNQSNVSCRRMRRYRYHCSQEHSEMIAREEYDEIVIDTGEFELSKLLVNAMYTYGADIHKGHDIFQQMASEAYVDGPSQPLETHLQCASDDDMQTMKEVLYYLGLPGGELQPEEVDTEQQLFDAIDGELYTDLEQWRASYLNAYQPQLDRLNEMLERQRINDTEPTAAEQEDVETTLQNIKDDIQRHDQKHSGDHPVAGSYVTVSGNQLIQDLDEGGDVEGLSAVYSGAINGVFDKVTVAPRVNDAYLQSAPEQITDRDRAELFEDLGLHMVLKNVSIVDRSGSIVSHEDDLLLPMQKSHSVVRMYNTDSTPE